MEKHDKAENLIEQLSILCSSRFDEIYDLKLRNASLFEALENVMGYLDTPIARRKLGIDPDAEWLQEARRVIKGETMLGAIMERNKK